MQLQELSSIGKKDIEVKAFKPKKANKPLGNKDITQQENIKTATLWQKDILLDAIESLENNVQMDNTHPLSMSSNAPIESFEEALKELNYIRSNKFREEASLAQANIKIENVLSLFTNQ